MYFVILVILLCLLLQVRVFGKFEHNNKLLPENFSLNILSKKEQDTYFATLIHDLKTPAFAQIRTLKMLLDGSFGTLNPEQHQILKEILGSEKYMADIVSDILTAYKCDNSALRLNKQVFDISDTLNTIYESVKYLAQERNQTLQINYRCSSLDAYGDKLQLTRVMTNLISNAVKYGNPNSIITVDLTNTDGDISFTVKNYGADINKEKLKKIFDKFTGGMSHYNSASTGLGLYLSKKIIQMHGGQIYAKSSDGINEFGFQLNCRKFIKEKVTSAT
ncbi:HAMP domain-containing histidine kinase [bacterium]|nr:HAMP domain-containing histidine kinase [bacterium]